MFFSSFFFFFFVSWPCGVFFICLFLFSGGLVDLTLCHVCLLSFAVLSAMDSNTLVCAVGSVER